MTHVVPQNLLGYTGGDYIRDQVYARRAASGLAAMGWTTQLSALAPPMRVPQIQAGSNVTITYNALGPIIAATGGATVIDSIADADTTNAPSRNAVFDALALKLDASALSSVTNDAQTKAAIVPNTAPSAGQLLVGNAGGTAYATVSASGDVTVASTGAMSLASPLIFACTVSAVSLGNDNAVHAIFPSANDALTVEASTTYFFDGVIRVTNGATTHTDAFGFGGTATFTSIAYETLITRVGGSVTTTQTTGHTTTNAMSVMNASAVQTGATLHVTGVMRINGAGTIIPQWQFSADPTGTNQVEPNSYLKFRKVGSNTVASVGAWA